MVEIYLQAKSIKTSDRGLWSGKGWRENKGFEMALAF